VTLDSILEKFTAADPRIKVPKHQKIQHIMGKSISDPQVNRELHNGLLPPDLIKDKTVLDFGPYIFLTGAWSLYHGAKFVTGVEYLKKNVDIGTQVMQECFTKNWNLINSTAENFIKNDDNFYDVILIAGTIQKLANKNDFLLWCIEHSNYVIIESNYPSMWHYLLNKEKWWNATDHPVFEAIYSEEDKQMLSKLLNSGEYGEWFKNFITNKLPLYQYSLNTKWSQIGGSGPRTSTIYTTPNFYEHFFTYKGWQYQSLHSDYLTKNMPDYYNFPRRFCVAYKKSV
jgi:precorrin-6B methylase 2